MWLINLIITIIIAGILGYQARNQVFPFNGFKWDNDNTLWGVLNCILTLYNIYAIITTWLMLGILTISAIIYLLLVITAVALGWNYKWTQEFIEEAKQYGFIKAFKNNWNAWMRNSRRK